MTTQTIILNQENHLDMNKSYDEYVKKALDEARVSIKAGNYEDFDKAMADLDKEFSENE